MSAPAATDTLTVTVPINGHSEREITVSAHCPRCGAKRSAIRMGIGLPRIWAHPCGHLDTAASLRAEAAARLQA
ncbi:hypothetical protein [Nocardia vaccinii]|uniref:hypothetical protein n=1 Tax=Nocardia vaccinii TaxID=1822 RepID=UPI000832E0E9|nr:hypothetical protein [Nocardia vaccinii]